MMREYVEQLAMTIRLYLAVILASPAALAAERYEYYNGVRALGMGGAGVAIVNDETALLVNPAALGKLRDHFITLIDPELGIGSQTERIMGTDLLKVTDPQEVLTKSLLDPNKHMHARAQVFPSFVVPNFGFGLLGKTEVNSEYNAVTNQFKYDYTNDYAAVFGFNFRFFGGVIKLGVNARINNRSEVRRTDIDPTSTNLDIKDLAREGVGVASDSGLIITAPIAWLPTLAATYRDMGRTSYTFRDGFVTKPNTTERPESTPESVDVGLAVFPIMGKRFRSSWTIEYRDVMTTGDEDDHMRRTHAGVEFNYADALFLRAGMNQRYYTAGLELAIVNYQFQAAYYGEEIGVADDTREDRRYVIKFAFRF